MKEYSSSSCGLLQIQYYLNLKTVPHYYIAKNLFQTILYKVNQIFSLCNNALSIDNKCLCRL